MIEKISKMISNLKVLSKMNDIIDGLNTHTTNTNNPHNVTAEQLGLATAYVYKGSVENFSDLPTNAQNGWVYSVENEHTDSSGIVHPAGANFAWSGSRWDDLGGSLSRYTTLDFLEDRLAPITNQVNTNKTNIEDLQKDVDTLNMETIPTAVNKAEAAATNAQNAAKEVKEIYGDGNFTPLSDLLGGLGTKLKRWGAIFANKVFASNLPIVYNSVAEMKADGMLWEGMNTKTLGYYTPNDGGGASYLIRSKADGDTDNGGSLYELANGLVAELIVENGTVSPEQFGAKGDGYEHIANGVDIEAKAIQGAINYSKDKGYIVLLLKKYAISDTITITGYNVKVVGKYADNYGIRYVGGQNCIEITNAQKVSFDGICITSSNKGTCFHLTNSSRYIHFNHIHISGFGSAFICEAGYYSYISETNIVTCDYGIKFLGTSGNFIVDKCRLAYINEVAIYLEQNSNVSNASLFVNGNVITNSTFETTKVFIHQKSAIYTKVDKCYFGDGCTYGIIIEAGDLTLTNPTSLMCGAGTSKAGYDFSGDYSAIKVLSGAKFVARDVVFGFNAKASIEAEEDAILDIKNCHMGDYRDFANTTNCNYFFGDTAKVYSTNGIKNESLTLSGATCVEDGKNIFNGKAYKIYFNGIGKRIYIPINFSISEELFGKPLCLVVSIADFGEEFPDQMIKISNEYITDQQFTMQANFIYPFTNDKKIYKNGSVIFGYGRKMFLFPVRIPIASGTFNIDITGYNSTEATQNAYLGRFEYAFLTDLESAVKFISRVEN